RLSVLQRFAIAAFSLAFYLRQSLLPTHLSPLYDLESRLDLTQLRYPLSAALVVASSIVALALRRRAPWLLVAWLTYVITLLPVLGLFQNGPQIAADRYTYLACLPWALLAGGAVTSALARVTRPAIVLGLTATLVAVVLGLQALTVIQIATWRDSIS